jgi:hypothetical protein
MFADFMEQNGSAIQYAVMGVVVLALIWAVAQLLMVKGKASPMPQTRALVLEKESQEGFGSDAALDHNSRPRVEGFYGGVAVGAGQPDCLRTLSDAAAVYGRFVGNVEGVEEGSKDLAELRLIFSKWACLKKDLLSPSGIVEATRYTPYSTLHDRIPTADIAGQCNSKTMPARDLDITFETWRDRAVYLLRRLCTAASLGPGEVDALEKQMLTAWADVYDVAKSQCLAFIPSGSKLLPRDAAPMTPDSVADLGPYKGYY